MTTFGAVIRFSPILLFLFALVPVGADASNYALTVYGAKMTGNNWEEIMTQSQRLDFLDSKLLVVALSRQVAEKRNGLSYEIEGQVARHFGIQDHWEFNLLGVARWHRFWWDSSLDTSAAFGLGGSYATEKPEAEVIIEGDSRRWMVYWMMELAFAIPTLRNVDLVTRIHHRSEAFGIVADEGGSNSLAVGLKYRF